MKYKAYLLALLCALFMSCKDDDDVKNEPEETTAVTEAVLLKMQQRESLATLLTMLTGQEVSPMGDIDFEGLTYEPAYGEVTDEAQPFCRAVRVRSAAEAEATFLMLVGGNERLVSETADGYVIDMTALDCHSTGKKQSLGTLTFHREGGRNDMGYAEVSIPCMPHLQQIDYKTRDQIGKNAAFASPCGYGDVYEHNGKYYICVKESEGYTANAAGKLVAMETGKGTRWRVSEDYEDEYRGLWLAEHTGSALDVTLYMLLCADEDFLPQKRRIVKNYPGKVFPIAQQFRNGLGATATRTAAADEGFGTLKAGYSHWIEWGWDDISDISSGVFVARDATIGSYVALFQGWYRNFHYVKFMPRCQRDKSVRERTYTFTNKQLNQFNSFLSFADAVYTCTVVSFNDQKPEGFSLIDI